MPEAPGASPALWPPAGCALITGAARGIGAAIAAGLAADGWPVAVNYNGSAQAAAAVVVAIEAAGGSAFAIQGDVTDRQAPERTFAAAEEHFGVPVLALVNNAGVTRDNLSPSLTDEEWEQVIDTDLTAAFRFTRRALKTMMRARNGRIVNIASVVGLRANPGQSNYAAAKAGLIQFTPHRRGRGRTPWGYHQRGRARMDRDRHDRRGQPRVAQRSAGQAGRHARGGRGMRTLPLLAASGVRDRRGAKSRWRIGRLSPVPARTTTERCT